MLRSSSATVITRIVSSVDALPLFLTHTRVNRDAGKVTFAKKFIQLGGPEGTFDENDNLVELQRVKQLVELPVFLRLAQLHVVLLQAMQRQFGLVVDVDLKGVLHELFANWPNLVRECRAKHHDLLVGGSRAEDLLDVASHI